MVSKRNESNLELTCFEPLGLLWPPYQETRGMLILYEVLPLGRVQRDASQFCIGRCPPCVSLRNHHYDHPYAKETAC